MELVLRYLNWDQEAKERAENPEIDEHPAMGPAGEIHHKAQTGQDDTPDEFEYEEFQDLYREVTEIDLDVDEEEVSVDEILGTVYDRFQRTGYTEGEEFLQLRYCENCDSYIEGEEEAITHAAQNHGYDSFQETGEPEYIRGIRSMTPGDVIQLDDSFYQVRGIGFEEIEVGGGQE